MAAHHLDRVSHGPAPRSSLGRWSFVFFALACLYGLPAVTAGGPNTQGRWTTFPTADTTWDMLDGGGKLLRGGGTHMALVRGQSDKAWVLHWSSGNMARVWYARTEDSTTEAQNVPLPTDSMESFCAGHSLLSDGKLLVVGGTLNEGGNLIGETGTNRTAAFNPGTLTWSLRDTLTEERW